jgi:peptide/nickel transport system permease protein
VKEYIRLRNRYTRRYLISRLLSLLGVLVVVLILNFLLPHLMPGSFVQTYADIIVQQTHRPFSQVLAVLESNPWFRPQPLPVAFLQYMKEALFTFPPNFGPSFEYYPLPAWTIVFGALKWTLLLLGLSQIIAWGGSIFIGVYLALHKNRLIDRILQPQFYFLNSIPVFWLALMFIFVFAVGFPFKILPAVGAYDITPTLPSVLWHLVLPLSVIIVVSLPSHVLVIRSAAIDVIGSDFVQASKAQGLSNRRLVNRVLRNSLIPSLTQVFLSIGYLIGGILTVELAFSYPGIGTVVENAVVYQDFPVAEAVFYVITLVVLLANLAADLLYPLIDPRVSYASE